MRACAIMRICAPHPIMLVWELFFQLAWKEKKSIVLVLEKTRNVKGRIFFFVRKKWGENSIPTQNIKARVSQSFSIFSLFLF
jgi:hypothetical protein